MSERVAGRRLSKADDTCRTKSLEASRQMGMDLWEKAGRMGDRICFCEANSITHSSRFFP